MGSVLSSFNDATVELPEGKQVPALKIIPVLKILDHALAEEIPTEIIYDGPAAGRQYVQTIKRETASITMSIMTPPTLLDPQFKSLGFLSQTKATTTASKNCQSSQAEGPSTSSLRYVLHAVLILNYYIYN